MNRKYNIWGDNKQQGYRHIGITPTTTNWWYKLEIQFCESEYIARPAVVE